MVHGFKPCNNHATLITQIIPHPLGAPGSVVGRPFFPMTGFSLRSTSWITCSPMQLAFFSSRWREAFFSPGRV